MKVDDTMRLVLPTKKYEDSYFSLIKCAKDNGDYGELGNALIKDGESFNQMICRLRNRRVGKKIAKRDVPATVYWIIVDGNVVGTIDLRHFLNKDYVERLGHVAYYIKPDCRNKGYATKALEMARKKYYDRFIRKILITCYSDNVASVKVIEKNGGTLLEKVNDEMSGKKISKYIIFIRNDEIISPKTDK